MALDYFAYGNNLNPEMLRRKGLNIERRTPARLHGYQLVFNKASQRAALPEVIGFANLEPRTNATVEGTLYSIPDEQQPVLDKGERYPGHYDRVTITVETSDGERSAITYVARAEHTREGLIPSQNYVNHMLSAGGSMSPEYRSWLEQLETYQSECATCHRVGTVLFQRENERMFVLCQPCHEAKRMWSDTLGRPLTIIETENVMAFVNKNPTSYSSLAELLCDAQARGLIRSAS